MHACRTAAAWVRRSSTLVYEFYAWRFLFWRSRRSAHKSALQHPHLWSAHLHLFSLWVHISGRTLIPILPADASPWSEFQDAQLCPELHERSWRLFYHGFATSTPNFQVPPPVVADGPPRHKAALLSCGLCNKPGHALKACPWRVCYACGGYGHSQKSCVHKSERCTVCSGKHSSNLHANLDPYATSTLLAAVILDRTGSVSSVFQP